MREERQVNEVYINNTVTVQSAMLMLLHLEIKACGEDKTGIPATLLRKHIKKKRNSCQ
jgi:hypothetical protein